MLESLWFCLVVVLLLGLIMVWFLSKRVMSKEQTKVKLLSNIITKKDNMVKDLESTCVERKNQLDRLIAESIVCRHQLLQKSNSLRKKSDELYRLQEKLEDVKSKIIYIERMEESRVEQPNDDNYIQISKDQFNQIEQSLKDYKSRVVVLKKESRDIEA